MLKKILSQEPLCPFCDQPFSRPVLEEPVKLGEFERGRCICGAFYVHDITGHNLGSAYIEILSYITNDDWELAWQLIPDRDYREARIENYDINKHLIQPTGRDEQGKRTRGVLIFMRLHEELEEISKIKMKIAGQEYLRNPDKKPISRKKYSKEDVNRAFSLYDIELLSEMAIHDTLVIRKLQQKLYSADAMVRWKTVIAIGEICKRIMYFHPSVVGDLVRRLIYSVNDSACASWGAIETICEIIRNNPRVFSPFINHVLSYLKDEQNIKAVLWGIGRINEKNPDIIKRSSFYSIYDFIKSPNPEIRGLAIFALGRQSMRISFRELDKLKKDEDTFDFFDSREIVRISVKKMLEYISEGKEMEKNDDKESRRKQAYVLYDEGVVNFNRGMTLDAIKSLEKAVSIFEEIGDDAGIANGSEKIGDCMVVRGNFSGAVVQYQRALAICEKYNDPVGVVILIEKLVDIYRKQGELENILSYSFYALEKLENTGDSGRAAMFISTIGDTYERQGKLNEALDSYRLAYKIFKGMGSRERAEILEKGISILEERLAIK